MEDRSAGYQSHRKAAGPSQSDSARPGPGNFSAVMPHVAQVRFRRDKIMRSFYNTFPGMKHGILLAGALILWPAAGFPVESTHRLSLAQLEGLKLPDVALESVKQVIPDPVKN